MRSCKSPFHPRNFSKCTFSAGVSVLFIFLMGFVFQGCVIHGHGNHNTRYKTKTHSNKNHQRHKHQDTKYRKPTPKRVDKIPSFEKQHPSHTHRPPSHARAYEVAQGRPFTKDEHPSSHGQGHKTNKGKPHMGDKHPSQHAKNDRGKGPKHDREKPLRGDDPPSFKGQDKPDKGKDHPSSHAQDNRGHQGRTPKGDEHPLAHAKADKSNQGQQGGPSKGHDRPSQGKSKPSMDSPMASVGESPQMFHKGKPDKKGSKGKENKKDTLANLSGQEDSSAQSFSPSESKGKPFKQDQGSARRPSGKEDQKQFQTNPTPEENIQVAKAEPGRGKDNSKGHGKANKKNRGKREQQTGTTAAVTQQEPAPSMAPSKPITTTASYAPSVFDNNQRNIIQNYFKNSGTKKSGKGKGKHTKGSKRNKNSSVVKNTILTQPTEPLPQSLESQLPPSPPNSKRVLYNQQVLLIERGTNRVLDVINLNN
ncbi:MAG: hypothetical protein V3V24_06340 [Nitrospinaceae bacterium]